MQHLFAAIYWNQGIVLHRGGHIGFSKTPSPIPKDEVSEMLKYVENLSIFLMLSTLNF